MDDEWSFFLGFGSLCDLRDSEAREPKLLNTKSVSRAAAYALQNRPESPARRPIGFHTGRSAARR